MDRTFVVCIRTKNPFSAARSKYKFFPKLCHTFMNINNNLNIVLWVCISVEHVALYHYKSSRPTLILHLNVIGEGTFDNYTAFVLAH